MIPGKGAPISKMDYTRKVLAGDFNPRKNTLAVASLNSFYVYAMWSKTFTLLKIFIYKH